ncbi:hypothetical protein POM88_019093 [Heracleum sosnowskyi]|uniref:Uncharacterized protein n=1 Tax=Heracleum sosnowskyi TaxID=360622 RepID=A0AAD8MVB0_9APIA|nr:hypothetical protein POM88_019093 [Heracleum sosnowskyi]
MALAAANLSRASGFLLLSYLSHGGAGAGISLRRQKGLSFSLPTQKGHFNFTPLKTTTASNTNIIRLNSKVCFCTTSGSAPVTDNIIVSNSPDSETVISEEDKLKGLVRSAAPLLSPAFLSAPLRGTPFRSPLPLSYTLIRSASRGPILCFYRSPAPPRAAPPRAAPPRAAPPRAAPPRSANPLSATPLSATLVRSASGYPVLCIYIHSPAPPFRPAAPLSAHQNSSKDPSV